MKQIILFAGVLLVFWACSANPASTHYQAGYNALNFLLRPRTQTNYYNEEAVRSYNWGIEKYEFGDYISAIEIFTEVIELDDLFVDAYIARGASKHKLELYEQAIEDYNLALALNNATPEAHRGKGISLMMLGDTLGMLAEYDIVVGLYPDESASFYYRGAVEDLLKDHEGA
ncbi:tetratricopeptide repeat protein, partial [Persicitalea sp.]|uniref:tetratricopeptide repeat protein n=1 Tax=Persicitalea sp. TaxID=3100273 RepID=UPI0035944200